MKNIIKKDPRIITKDLKDLLVQPKVIRVTKFNEDAASKFADDMSEAHNTGQPVIPVLIDSYGGYVYSLLSMVSEIENSKLPVATISVGKSMSCGAILLSAGTPGYRYMDKNSTVMVHEVGSAAWGKLEEMKVSVKEAERLNKVVLEKMAKWCGHKDKNYFVKLIAQKKNADWFLSANDALKHKIVDHIGLPSFETEVTVKTRFVK